METATAKNKGLSQAGAHVPNTFDELGETIRYMYLYLVVSRLRYLLLVKLQIMSMQL